MEETEEYHSDDSAFEPEFIPTFEAADLLQINHSYGYDCKRLYNMVLIDDNTLVFASGTFLHFFNIKKRTVTFRKSVFQCGIGFVTKNYHQDFQRLLTVAENGPQATVFIYEFPSLKVRVKLERAAKQQFTCGAYNHSGELFASQAGYPDFMLTIWRWQSAEVILRSKAFQNDVLQIHFSKFNPILLVSCGLSHIKFWKMANTFTGLKLKGDLGRFGKTDFSDIYAIYMLADENVISGCEWGNMLLWEAGLIKFEITRAGRKPCHTKPIVRITMENNEVTTVGMDGYVRIWFWGPIDLADPPDDDRFVEIEPIYEFFVGKCEIRAIEKIKLYTKNDFGYYMLDGSGGIWFCDLNTKDIPRKSYKLYNCHGGRIIAAQTSPMTPHMITIGEDGKISAYNYETKTLLTQRQFSSVGTDILWFSSRVSLSSRDLVASFEDGFIRQLYFDLNVQDDHETATIELLKVTKAHTAAVTRMSLSTKQNYLVTGSADCTIFIYAVSEKFEKLDFVILTPMGFVELGAVPNCFNWKDDKYTVLVGCKTGEVFEYRLPNRMTEDQTFLTYNITDKKELKAMKFVSVKSTIRRDLRRAAIKKRKEKKKKKKLAKIEKLKKDNPGLQIDMEVALADSEPEEEEDPLFIPANPNPVLWLRYTDRNTIWVSMGGYDAGYIYELKPGVQGPVQSTIIADGDDCEIHSFLDIEEYLVLGLVNGKLRINLTNAEDFTDLRNYRLMNVHDPLNGTIPRIMLSYDCKVLITIGYDGNIFTFDWFGPEVPSQLSRNTVISLPPKIIPGDDITDPNYLSLEEDKIYAERKRQEEAAEAHAQKVLAEIAILQEKFDKLRGENLKFDTAFRIPYKNMLMDERVTDQIKDELQFQLDDVREDLAYDLEKAEVGKRKLYNYFIRDLDHIPIKVNSFRSDVVVYSFRIEGLDETFLDLKDEVEDILKLEELRRRSEEYDVGDEKMETVPDPPEETFFFGRKPKTIIPRFSKKMLRVLNSYRARQIYEINRVHNWEKWEREKPNPDQNHPDDERKISEAKKSLGDYKLKTGAAYEPQSIETLAYKYMQVLDMREKICTLINDFNDRVFDIRDAKCEAHEMLTKLIDRLHKIQPYIPKKNRRPIPTLLPTDWDEAFPEKNLVPKCFPGCGIEVADIIYLNNRVENLLPKPPPPKLIEPPLTMEDMYELEQSIIFRVYKFEIMPNYTDILKEISKMPNFSEAAYWSQKEDHDSAWLIEKRYFWLMHMIEEQDDILEVIEQTIMRFDNDMQELSEERVQVKLQVDFMNSLMTCLNQELFIMRDSEQIENQLLTNADTALTTRNQAQSAINILTRQIDDLRKSCERINDQIGVIQTKFLTNTKGHKFFEFLRRIFRKKWRPPKPPRNEDESSESSDEDESTTEEEDDTKSIDSTDMTSIRLDEAHCPAGLERTMYDFAFKLRADRHELERALSDALKEIDMKRDEIKDAQKNVKYHTDIYNQEKDTLLAFRRKRQQELNKIYVSAVLRMNQMQHFRMGQDYRDLTKAVLFDSSRLDELKGRVHTLKKETIETKRLHRINIVHLRRMNADIKFMRSEIINLEGRIKEEMIKKFGMIINLDELEEEVLRKYIFELETTAEQEIDQIIKEINKRKIELAMVKDELVRDTRRNCEKTNKLTVLTEEKFFLEKILLEQETHHQKWLKPPDLSWDRENEKLVAIEKEQKDIIQCLEREIATLRIKAKPLQIDDDGEEVITFQEIIPQEDIPICLEIFQPIAYQARLTPDDFIMERCQKVVQKYFMRRFGKQTGANTVRHYSYKVNRYLGQVAYTLEGDVTDNILDCLIDNMKTILPKKYMILISREDVDKMFREILSVFDYERSEVNTDEVIASIYDNAKNALKNNAEILNTAQFLFVEMIKELVEVLPLEELQRENTVNAIVDNLVKEPYFDGRCLNVEDLVGQVVEFAREHLIDNITSIPIRNLAVDVQKEYTNRRPCRYAVNQCQNNGNFENSKET